MRHWHRFAQYGLLSLVSCAWFACSEKSSAAPPAPTPAPAPIAPTSSAKPPTHAAPARATAPIAELGKPAPNFTLTDIDGVSHELAKLKGKTVVLEWFNPQCPFVKHAHTQGPLRDQAARTQNDKIVWLSINSGAPGKQGHGLEANKAVKVTFTIANPILLDESGQVGHAYGAIKTPHLFIVDDNGTLVYRGGVDNAPVGTVDDARPKLTGGKPGEVINYVDAALQDLKAGKPLRLPDTPPYGCSVKYSS